MLRKFEYVNRVKSTGYEVIEPKFNLPQRSTRKSAGYDFFAPERVEIKSYKIGDKPVCIPTGVKVYMPDDEFLMLANRSSNPQKKCLVVPQGVGIIDADYVDNPNNEGEMAFVFYNLSNETVIIEQNEKIGQGIFVKYGITDDDSATNERVGGFGSTGK